MKLERSEQSEFLPAPKITKAGDYLYTSTIYPIASESGVILSNSSMGQMGDSDIELQTSLCFEKLEDYLKIFNSDFSKLIKVEVCLASADDFFDFKRVWKNKLGDKLPARTTLVVGDNFPMPNCKISLDAIALDGGSKFKLEYLNDPESDANIDAECASHAVRAGDLVFCSAFTATDFIKGIAVGKPPGFPNYGNNAQMQMEYICERLNRVLSQVGTSLENCVDSQLYETDLLNFHAVDGVTAAYMGVCPPRSSMGVNSLVVPGALCTPNLTVLIPNDNLKKTQSFEGLRWHPVSVRGVNFSPTMIVGDWRFFAGQIPTNDFKSYEGVPDGMKNTLSEIEQQTNFTMELLTEQLEANQTDWNNCYQVRMYLIEPTRDFRVFKKTWEQLFPDPSKAPSLTYVPSVQANGNTGIMFDGPLIEIDPSCISK
jgi:enamine deaminase RidA (YjgF/YER057c/UK114 family)